MGNWGKEKVNWYISATEGRIRIARRITYLITNTSVVDSEEKVGESTFCSICNENSGIVNEIKYKRICNSAKDVNGALPNFSQKGTTKRVQKLAIFFLVHHVNRSVWTTKLKQVRKWK